MNVACKNIAVLGSTGSIGQNALDVVGAMPDRFRVVGLSAHHQLERLACQAGQFSPEWIVATGNGADDFQWPPMESRVITDGGALTDLVTTDNLDLIVSAIVGIAGLESNWAALGAGKTIALANKETLVAAGKLVMNRAKEHGATLLPVDSEHNAIFQALQSGRRDQIQRVILTASGGPFRNRSLAEMKYVTVEQTLDHPTWNMGRKITIDSATMMNKALEIVEARWMFDLDPDQIQVVIHPESIVHSLVEFTDGSVIAQLSPPDMRLPIQYAMTFPDRVSGPARRMDWSQTHELNLIPPDFNQFPALALGFEVAKIGGTSGAVVNAANESAVQAFIDGKIGFTEIVQASRETLENHEYIDEPTIDDIVAADRWAREEIDKWIST